MENNHGSKVRKLLQAGLPEGHALFHFFIQSGNGEFQILNRRINSYDYQWRKEIPMGMP